MYLGRSLRPCRSAPLNSPMPERKLARAAVHAHRHDFWKFEECGEAFGGRRWARSANNAACQPGCRHKSGRLQPNAVHHVRLIFQPGSECRRKLSARCRVRESVLGSFAGLGHARTRGRKPATAAGVAGGSRQRRCFQAPRAACQRVDQQARACPPHGTWRARPASPARH